MVEVNVAQVFVKLKVFHVKQNDIILMLVLRKKRGTKMNKVHKTVRYQTKTYIEKTLKKTLLYIIVSEIKNED